MPKSVSQDPDQYQSIVHAEWQVIYDKLDACVDIVASIVLSKTTHW